jgi:predicted DCC family thiol-disulfide oxidoreductase YuxK
MPRHVQVAAWLLLASVYTVLWLTTLLLGEWASTVQPWRLGQPAALQWLGEPWMRVAAWSLAGSWLVFVPLAIHPRTRPWGWLAVGLVNMVVLPMAGQGLSGAALGALHLFTFDPAWLAPGAPGTRGNRGAGGRRRAPATADIVFYDGLCGLCHRWVRFILAEDWTGQQFVLSPLQGELIDRRLTPQQQDALPDSVVVLTPDDQVLTRSAAVIRLLDRLGGLWRGASWLLWLVPGPLRDLAYDTLAASRTRLFRKPEGLCPVMPPSLRERFVL